MERSPGISDEPVVGVAKPTFLGPLVPASVGVVCWFLILGTEGWVAGMKYSWLLLLAVSLGCWIGLPRLHYWPTRLELTVGPWRRAVDLTDLKGIRWKSVRGAGNQGKLLITDRHGGLIPIYVGRFSKTQEWCPLLLGAAEHSDAYVESRARSILAHGSRTKSQ
jgi:hypothetical protein